MDFESTVDSFEGLPPKGIEAWVRIAEKAFQETILENRAVSTPELQMSNANQLVDFLRQLAKRLNVMQPRVPDTNNPAARMRYVDEYIKKQTNILIAEKVASELENGQATVSDRIEVSNSGIVKIHSLIGDLRRTVDGAELSKKKKKMLHSKLDEFERELVSRSVSGTKIFAVLALVGAVVAGTASTLADMPDTIETIGKITAYLGIEKQNQTEAAQIAAEAEALALEAPTTDEEDD